MLRLTLYVILVSGVYETIGAPPAEHQFNDLKPFHQSASGVNLNAIDGIVGGNEVDIKEYPYQVVLFVRGRFNCGGSIISDRYVLTARHCIDKVSAQSLSVRVGSSMYDKGGVLYRVESIIIHNMADIGIIQMEKMELDGVTSAAVKLPAQGSSLAAGKPMVVTGWGDTTEGGVPSTVLRAVSMPVVALDKCNETYNGIIDKYVICAGLPEGGKDACQGDSGGPAVAADSGLQYGIVSGGYGCAREGIPGLYTNVALLRDWIKEVTGV